MSISDMFYVQPAIYNDLYFMGGIPDLVPIELAQAMGNKIITEIKSGYSFTELSLIRSVFGFDVRKRLKETNSANCFMKIDTRMMDDDLEGAYISKKIDWRNLRININNDISFTEFFRQINLQWE